MSERPQSPAEAAAPLVEALVADAAALGLGVCAGPLGCRIVDAGLSAPGSEEAGRRIAGICLGGLGRVAVRRPRWSRRPLVAVATDRPALACLGSQYAGWTLGSADGGWSALGSGPARAMAAREAVFGDLSGRDAASGAVLVLETDAPPPARAVAEIAQAVRLPPDRVTLVLAPTASVAGMVQVVARVAEVAMSRARAAGFPLHRILRATGLAPLPALPADGPAAMAASNDAIRHRGRARLVVEGPEGEAAALAEAICRDETGCRARRFADLFDEAGGDFHALHPAVFAPAEVMVTARDSGRTFRAGSLSPVFPDASFP